MRGKKERLKFNLKKMNYTIHSIFSSFYKKKMKKKP